MSTKSNANETTTSTNAYASIQSTAPPRYAEFAGVRAYGYGAQALLRLAERSPDTHDSTILIAAAVLADVIRFGLAPPRKRTQRSEDQ